MCQCACKICPYISYVLFFNSEFYFYCFIALVNQKSNVQNHCYFFCFCHKSKREEETTKILSLEMTIFGLKMMVKSGLEKKLLKFHVPLQSCCCPVQKKLPRKAELAWQVSLKGHVEFQNNFFQTTFQNHF